MPWGVRRFQVIARTTFALPSADVIFGGSGDDNLVGGTRPDVLDGGRGLDSYNGGGGTDVCGADPFGLVEVRLRCELS